MVTWLSDYGDWTTISRVGKQSTEKRRINGEELLVTERKLIKSMVPQLTTLKIHVKYMHWSNKDFGEKGGSSSYTHLIVHCST